MATKWHILKRDLWDQVVSPTKFTTDYICMILWENDEKFKGKINLENMENEDKMIRKVRPRMNL